MPVYQCVFCAELPDFIDWSPLVPGKKKENPSDYLLQIPWPGLCIYGSVTAPDPPGHRRFGWLSAGELPNLDATPPLVVGAVAFIPHY